MQNLNFDPSNRISRQREPHPSEGTERISRWKQQEPSYINDLFHRSVPTYDREVGLNLEDSYIDQFEQFNVLNLFSQNSLYNLLKKSERLTFEQLSFLDEINEKSSSTDQLAHKVVSLLSAEQLSSIYEIGENVVTRFNEMAKIKEALSYVNLAFMGDNSKLSSVEDMQTEELENEQSRHSEVIEAVITEKPEKESLPSQEIGKVKEAEEVEVSHETIPVSKEVEKGEVEQLRSRFLPKFEQQGLTFVGATSAKQVAEVEKNNPDVVVIDLSRILPKETLNNLIVVIDNTVKGYVAERLALRQKQREAEVEDKPRDQAFTTARSSAQQERAVISETREDRRIPFSDLSDKRFLNRLLVTDLLIKLAAEDKKIRKEKEQEKIKKEILEQEILHSELTHSRIKGEQIKKDGLK